MSFVVFQLVNRARKPGEDVIDAAKRMLIEYALSQSHTQVEAAEMLGMSPRRIHYQLDRHSLRPVDAWLRRKTLSEQNET